MSAGVGGAASVTPMPGRPARKTASCFTCSSPPLVERGEAGSEVDRLRRQHLIAAAPRGSTAPMIFSGDVSVPTSARA
jgi:hypothetical protein